MVEVETLISEMHDETVRTAEFYLRESTNCSVATPEMVPVIAVSVAELTAQHVARRVGQQAYANGQMAVRAEWERATRRRTAVDFVLGVAVVVAIVVTATGWIE